MPALCPLPSDGWRESLPCVALSTVRRNCVPTRAAVGLGGVKRQSPVPSFAGSLSETQIQALALYVLCTSGGAPAR
ncbi:MAG: hypothetical protein RLZZ618_595 [Pseudomonadota bacterium]